jgi:hypothetical protein
LALTKRKAEKLKQRKKTPSIAFLLKKSENGPSSLINLI